MTAPPRSDDSAEAGEKPKRDMLFVNCQDGSHRWRHTGARACCCELIDEDTALVSGECSIPVYRCADCGDYDYGENAEAAQVKADCAGERQEARAA